MKMLKQAAIFLTLLLVSVPLSAQNRMRITNASLANDQSVARKTSDPTYIPGGSRVYVADINGLPGFENNLVAAFQKKRVNLIVVADRSQADFEINGFAENQ
ncbi:MAG TPA: hypothetical protein VIW64_06460, partial [Pyrinomonadaceae bacterium]